MQVVVDSRPPNLNYHDSSEDLYLLLDCAMTDIRKGGPQGRDQLRAFIDASGATPARANTIFTDALWLIITGDIPNARTLVRFIRTKADQPEPECASAETIRALDSLFASLLANESEALRQHYLHAEPEAEVCRRFNINPSDFVLLKEHVNARLRKGRGKGN